ncbi:MAG: DUF4886 domain-containing protein, partial [Oscillospiraceae bacterium]|nr:DUF4886 domain-containing protein [Oscillospiraceae bacterium]
GGNIYAAGNSKKLELINCLITDGTAATGGNITINNGVFTISGGEVSYGTATGNGGNINANTATGLTLTGGAMLRGGHTDSYGGNIYVEDTVNLAEVTFHNGSAVTSGGDVYLSGTSKLTIDSGLAGDVYLCAAAKILTPGENGTVVGNLFLKEGAEFNANIYLGGSYNNAALLLVGDSFCTASTMVTDGKTEQWYASNAEAVAACQKGQYIKLYTNNDLVLTKDLYVDLNGYTVAASGSGTLYGMDCVGDDYTGNLGKVTVSGGVTVAGETTAPGGNRYIALTEDGAYTFHRLDLRITGVSIRPSCAGIYYTAKWACDDTLKAQIASYGVVASTANMPGSNFASEEENIYTSFTKDSFVSGETKTGAVISGILKDDGRSVQENTEHGKQKVYAKAYIVFENGQTLVSADNVGLSLYEVMKNLDRLIMEKSNTYRRYTNTARAFYETWKENGMGDWELKKIPDPGEDGIINLLMIGNSFCSYYVDELHYLAAAAGIQMRVCNVYYSGCPIKKHYNWWIEGEANYQFFEIFSDTNGRVGTSNMSLEQCLAQYEWDVIT